MVPYFDSPNTKSDIVDQIGRKGAVSFDFSLGHRLQMMWSHSQNRFDSSRSELLLWIRHDRLQSLATFLQLGYGCVSTRQELIGDQEMKCTKTNLKTCNLTERNKIFLSPGGIGLCSPLWCRPPLLPSCIKHLFPSWRWVCALCWLIYHGSHTDTLCIHSHRSCFTQNRQMLYWSYTNDRWVCALTTFVQSDPPRIENRHKNMNPDP